MRWVEFLATIEAQPHYVQTERECFVTYVIIRAHGTHYTHRLQAKTNSFLICESCQKILVITIYHNAMPAMATICVAYRTHSLIDFYLTVWEECWPNDRCLCVMLLVTYCSSLQKSLTAHNFLRFMEVEWRQWDYRQTTMMMKQKLQ